MAIPLLFCSSYTQSLELLGAGATFPYPLYSKMFDVYNKQKNVRINYQSIGSGGGIQQLISKTVNFGATDAFMSDEELAKAPAKILHVPICLGAVVITYNIPNNPAVNLSPDVLADIFLMKITKWNDPRITAINATVKLPNLPIAVIHRSDGSGTTAIFTDYLSKVSPGWSTKVGKGKSVSWPGGLGAKGNEGVAGMVKQIPGSIGYCELAYVNQNKMAVAALKNKSGKFILPSIESTTTAADVKIPADSRVTLTDTENPAGYPIAGFTWIILYADQNYGGQKKEKVSALVAMLWWMIHDGQQYARPLDYAPLPPAAVKTAETILKSVTFSGTALIK